MTSDAVRHHPVFGPTAPAWGWVPAPRYWLRRRRVLTYLRRLPRGTLLEIGCGAGALLAEARRLGFDGYAIETSPAARALAQRINDDTEGRRIGEAAGKDWPAQFDLIAAFDVLEHIEDDAAALRQWREWLKPGGHLLLSVPAHQRLWNPSDEWVGHYRRYGRGDLAAAIAQAGLEMIDCECYGYPLANLSERLRVWFGKRPAPDMAARTAQSGIDRRAETRLWPLVDNPLGVAIFLAADWLQRRFLAGDRGNGLLLLARRP